MLNAILSSKAGRLHDGDAVTRWRDLFKGSEDLVTATVMERLSYLSGSTSWSILRASMSETLTRFRLGELVEIEFWPMWEFEGKKIGVEPDVLITFTVGDPEKRVHLIVESKYRGNPQRVSQWAEQLSAYRQSIDSEVIDPADYVVYMALDGLSSRHISNTDLIADAYANSDIQATEIDNLSFVLIGWMDLVKACASVEPVNSGEQRILDDMTKALNLFGYSFIETPRGLEKLKPLTAGTSTLRALALEEI